MSPLDDHAIIRPFVNKIKLYTFMKIKDKVWLNVGNGQWILVKIVKIKSDRDYSVIIIEENHPEYGKFRDVKHSELKPRIPVGGIRWTLPQITMIQQPLDITSGGQCPHCGKFPPNYQPDNRKCDSCGYQAEAMLSFKQWFYLTED